MKNIHSVITTAKKNSGIDIISYKDLGKKGSSILNNVKYSYEVEMITGLRAELIINRKLNRAFYGFIDDQPKGISMLTELFVFLDFINDELKKRAGG